MPQAVHRNPLHRHRGLIALALLLAPTVALGWTAPLVISNAGTGREASVPRIAAGFGGRALVAYQQKDWRIRYRERSAAGVWSAIQVISPSGVFAVRPVIIEDPLERPHVIYAENDAGGVLDLVDLYRDQGTWHRTQITSTSTRWDDYPAVGMDSLGRLHLISVDYIDGQGGNIVYRRWDNGTWSAPTTLGSTDSPFYRRPDCSVDSAGKVHVAWATTGGDKYVVNYRRYDGSGWSATQVIGQSINQSFVSSVRIGAASPTQIVVVWDDGTGRFVSSANGGAAWTATQSLGSFVPSNIDAAQGTAWICGHDRNDRSRVLMSQWLGSAWSSAQRVNNGQTEWKGWSDCAIAPDSSLHVVYDDVVDTVNTHEISYVMQASTAPTGSVSGIVRDQSGPLPGTTIIGSLGGSATTSAAGAYTLTSPVGTIMVRASRPGYADVDVAGVVVNQGQNTPLPDIIMTAVAPAPITSFVAVPMSGKIRLSWQNSSSLNFTGTMIRFRTDAYPAGPTDGTLLVDQAGLPGAAEIIDHTGVTNGQTYYYAGFAHDDRPVRSYASGVVATALPAVKLDRDKDGDVDQSDYGWFQTCISGANVFQVSPACADAKLDEDDDVDATDVGIFLGCMTPPGVPAVGECPP